MIRPDSEHRGEAASMIRRLGDPVLRQETHPIDQFDESLRLLVLRMEEAMREAEGVGLAATQIGSALRVMVYDIGEGLVPCVNPEVIEASDELEEYEEGCLSLPGVSIGIERPAKVRLAYQDLEGNSNIIEAEGLLARVIQHEIDHLDGVLIIDRATPENRRKAIETFTRQIATSGKYPDRE